jgi:uncharacterized cupredoxin-like copper-binding protein
MRTGRRAGWAGALVSLLFGLTGCLAATDAGRTVALIPGYQGGGGGAPAAQILGYPEIGNVVTVDLSETDATHMAITMSTTHVAEGKVNFLVTNSGTKTHEFVVLATDTPAANFPIVSFEGEANRIDEDAKGVTNVGETGDMEPGAQQVLTIDLASGHYAVVCNLPGHYAMGMHQDFWATPKGATPVTVSLGETSATAMFIHLSQSYAPEGKVAFLITNDGTKDHEFVALQTTTPAADFPITGFEGEPDRFDEDAKGLTNVGETGDPAMKPGTSMMIAGAHS